jgi:hypothetical protein
VFHIRADTGVTQRGGTERARKSTQDRDRIGECHAGKRGAILAPPWGLVIGETTAEVSQDGFAGYAGQCFHKSPCAR